MKGTQPTTCHLGTYCATGFLCHGPIEDGDDDMTSVRIPMEMTTRVVVRVDDDTDDDHYNRHVDLVWMNALV